MNDTEGLRDFIGKLEWEGGVVGGLEYGLSSRDYTLPKTVSDAWSEIRSIYEDLENAIADFWSEVDEFNIDE